MLFILLSHAGLAQQIDSMMAVTQEQFPKEKIHIHFDRSIYNKSETIWYKVYILAGNELSALSKNVYVEWYDTTGKMLSQTVAPLFQASAKGSFDVPANYTGNFLHVKAYTRWMLNDDSAFIYERDLLINNPVAAQKKNTPAVTRTKLELFPEGGCLVQGLNTRIAFKATNQFGMPVRVKALLQNDKGRTLDTLKVKHDGMGFFYLLCNPNEMYRINWTDEYGNKGSVPVVAGKQEGTSLAISTTNDKAFVKVERTTNVTDNFKQLHLLVHMNQQLFYKVALNMTEKTSLNAQIPIDELPTGILQFSLFTSDWIPVAERIAFVNNHLHEFNVKFSTPIVGLEKRARNIIEILVNDTASANMSVAVTDASVVPPDKQTIFSDFLLSDDIKGKVHNPAYYFTSDADSITSKLDLVMLTNGWRRFDWDRIRAKQLPSMQYPRETDYLKLTGKVYGMSGSLARMPLQLNFILRAKDSSSTLLFVPIEKDGSFEQKGLFFYDTVKAFYSFNGKEKLTDLMQVQVGNGLLRLFPKSVRLGTNEFRNAVNDSLASLQLQYFFAEQEKLRKLKATATLQEVTVRAKAKDPLKELDQKYASGLFSGGDGYSFDLTSDKTVFGAMDVLSYLQGKVAGLMVSGSGSQASVSWRGGAPDLFLNEMHTDIGLLQGTPVSDIAYIKVFRPPFFGSVSGGSNGAIAVYTKRGGEGRKSDSNSRGMENTILGGYSRFKEFYNPSYEKSADNFDPDVRTTLYWNPFVLTNKKSPRVKLEFYNNDISKKLQVVLEGVNSEGKMIRMVKLLE
jgi:hypothetical protein